MKRIRWTVACVAAAFLACGGGGGESSDPGSQPNDPGTSLDVPAEATDVPVSTDPGTPDAVEVVDVPIDTPAPDACTPVCTNRQCGTDGCGGSCGTCSGTTPYCQDDGTCSDQCVMPKTWGPSTVVELMHK